MRPPCVMYWLTEESRFKHKKVKSGFFEQGKFSIEKTDKPTEYELLKRILDESSDIKNSAWGNKIRARLAQLKP